MDTKLVTFHTFGGGVIYYADFRKYQFTEITVELRYQAWLNIQVIGLHMSRKRSQKTSKRGKDNGSTQQPLYCLLPQSGVTCDQMHSIMESCSMTNPRKILQYTGCPPGRSTLQMLIRLTYLWSLILLQ